jgi:polyphenol oxidase
VQQSELRQGAEIRSELLTRAGFTHVFFTRRGGVSEGGFASLNASPDVGDRAEHVTENLRRIARVLGVGPAELYVPRQVHGRGVLVLGRERAQGVVATTPADAIVTSEPALACAVRTADCVPILLGDPESGRVAAVHAGWRGVAQDIARATVEVMTRLGSRAAAITAAIGPHISVEAFEVGDDVARQLARASGAADVILQTAGHKARADLGKILVSQLVAAGLAPGNVEQLPGCTYRDGACFFSYRRDGLESGRMLSAIVSKARVRSGKSGVEVVNDRRNGSE